MSILEVARLANVSTATVSRTINSPSLVDPQTAARVQRAIEDLNYVPDTHARTLVSGRSRILGLIVSDITNPFFPELIKGCTDVAFESGYDILVGATDYSCERMELSLRRMLERKVDGIAVMTSEHNESTVRQLGGQHIPIAFLDQGPVGLHFGTVAIDYAKGIGEALDHLVALGHRRLAFIGGPGSLPSAQMRAAAFKNHVLRSGLPFHPELMVESDLSVDGGSRALERLLAAPRKPTAILAANDLSAIGALHAAHQAKLDVPASLSIIGFDDIHLAEFTEPPLTTIRLERRELARKVVTWLISEVQGVPASIDLKDWLETTLIVRRTTGPAAGALV